MGMLTLLWLNWLYPKNEQVEYTHFLHFDTNPRKLKVTLVMLAWRSKIGTTS